MRATFYPMLVHPQFDPIAVSIGPVALRWYGLMYLIGFALAWAAGRYRIARTPGGVWTAKDIDDALFYAIVGTIAGGRLGYVLFYKLADFAAEPWRVFYVWEGGMSFHGGLLGIVAASILFARRRGLAILEVGDAIACAAAIGLFLGRLANFINGELWGRPSDVPWAMAFPGGGPQPRHPSQLYEAGLEGVLLLLVMTWLALRPRTPGSAGRLAGAFLIGYGIARSIA
ncbi:MAG: prolipoprotein diacylglyceryl transferase, partial [Burkholderiales bacterium]